MPAPTLSPPSRLRKTLLHLQLSAYFIPVNAIVRVFVLLRSLFGPDNLPRRSLSISTPAGHKLHLCLYPPTSPPKAESASYEPKQQLQQHRRPVHINFHGGGFCLPLHGCDARFCHLLSSTLDCWVVDATYRLAPRHPFPAAYDDARAVLDWVRRDELGVFDTERITLGGFSAGGNLALALAATAEEDVIKGVVAFYPIVDFTRPYAEKPAPAKLKLTRDEGMVVTLSDGARMLGAYMWNIPSSDGEALSDPRLSPACADPHRFPDNGRTMLFTCEYDYLAPEGRALVKKLEEAGREPVGVHVRGRGHSWDGTCEEGSEGARVRNEMWKRAVEVVGRAQTWPL